LELIRREIQRHKYSLKAERNYADWVKQYTFHHNKLPHEISLYLLEGIGEGV
jgi:hypothetical protein